MLRTVAPLVLVVVLAPCLQAASPDSSLSAEQIIDRAIEAIGGKEQAARLRTVIVKGTTTAYLPGLTLSGTGTFSADYPDLYHEDVTMMHQGEPHRILRVFNHGEGWKQMDWGATTPMTFAEVRFQSVWLRQNWHETLLPLKGSDAKLQRVPAEELDGRKVVGVKITAADMPDQLLFFDEQTGLLAKTRVIVKGASGVPRTTEMMFLDYQVADGVRYPTHQVTFTDGKKTAEFVTIEFKPGVNHAPDRFKQP